MNRMDPLAVLLRCPVSVRIVVMICMVVIGLTPSAAARADDLSCPKTTHAIQVDGALDEWEGALTSLESGKLSAAMRHDDRYLYLAIAISDPVYQRQVLGQGLFVYLDVQGGKERDFGVHFPLGLSEMGLRPDRAADREDEGPPDPERMQMRGPDPSALQQLYDGVASELEVIDGPYSSHRLRVDATPGVQVVERYANAILTYELRVPLRKSDDEPYAIGIEDMKKKIGVGLITPQLADRNGPGRPPRGEGGGPGWGGMGGPGGGRSGGGPGGPPPGGGRFGSAGRGRPERLEIWTKAKLAS